MYSIYISWNEPCQEHAERENSAGDLVRATAVEADRRRGPAERPGSTRLAQMSLIALHWISGSCSAPQWFAVGTKRKLELHKSEMKHFNSSRRLSVSSGAPRLQLSQRGPRTDCRTKETSFRRCFARSLMLKAEWINFSRTCLISLRYLFLLFCCEICKCV